MTNQGSIIETKLIFIEMPKAPHPFSRENESLLRGFFIGHLAFFFPGKDLNVISVYPIESYFGGLTHSARVLSHLGNKRTWITGFPKNIEHIILAERTDEEKDQAKDFPTS